MEYPSTAQSDCTCYGWEDNIQQLDRLPDGIGKLHHTIQKLRPLTTALWTMIHVDLEP